MHAHILDNTRELELLRNDPGGFLLAYQDIIHIIVRKYIASGMFAPDEHDDVVQTVNETLLRTLPRIKSQYNGSTLVKTYVSAIIRNICLKIREAKRREPRSVPLSANAEADPEEFDETSMDSGRIDGARRLFRAILLQYDHRDQLSQLLLFLKLRYRLHVTADDILHWYPGCRRSDLKLLLAKFTGKYEDMEEQDIYRILTPIANKAHGKTNSEDAIRKWTRTRIGEILELLNGSPPTSCFDEESLGVLLEDYFSPFLRA